jgi:hypothetical protein
MADAAEQIAPPPRTPKKNWAWVVGAAVLAQANALLIQKHGNEWPDAVFYFLYGIVVLMMAIAAYRYEAFHKVGGRLKEEIKSHVVSFSLICLLLLVVSCNTGVYFVGRLSHRQATIAEAALNRPPSNPAGGSTGNAPGGSGVPAAHPPIVAPTVIAQPVGPTVTVAPTVKLRSARPKKEAAEKLATPPTATAPQNPSPTPPIQAGRDAITQTMTNSPGGIQAGHDLTVIGDLPKPNRSFNPEDVKRAVAVLKKAPAGTRIYVITFPTNARPGSEISEFADQIENVFSQGGCFPYREHQVFLGSFSAVSEGGSHHGEGIGCTIPRGMNANANLAMQALNILHYPCHAPSVFTPPEDADKPAQWGLYISVGTRIEPE